MWSQHFIYFCNENDYFTLYATLPNKSAFAIHSNEKRMVGYQRVFDGQNDHIISRTEEIEVLAVQSVSNRSDTNTTALESCEEGVLDMSICASRDVFPYYQYLQRSPLFGLIFPFLLQTSFLFIFTM